jgi:hypothetical protein
MKFKDFFAKLKNDGKINQAEYVSFLESVPDGEIPDKAVEAFEASFLTVDRASTDKSVHSKLKREFLDPLDNDFKKILTVIDGVDKFKASEIDKIGSTYEKSAAITAYLPQLLEKIKATPSTDEDTKKELKKHKDTVQELMAKIETMNSETSNREKHWQKEAEEKINGFKLNMELEKLANGIKFGKAYSDDAVRKDITKVKLDSLRASYPLSLVEKDGQTTIQVLDKEGKPRFYENSNTPVTINKLLEDAFQPYIKSNNTGDDDEGQEQKSQETKRFKVSDENKTQFRQGARTTVTQK